MKWLSSKFIYPLIVFSLIASIVLQFVWLNGLFEAQRDELQKSIEGVVSNAAKQTRYRSFMADKRGNQQLQNFPKLKEFMLSPQWLQIQQAFDNLKIEGVHTGFHYQIGKDSALLNMQFSFKNAPNSEKNKTSSKNAPLSPAEKNSLLYMDSLVNAGVKQLGINLKTYYAIYNYDNNSLLYYSHQLRAAHYSERYVYHLDYSHTYQLLYNGLNGAVFYKIRYYLLSSLLMVLLTLLAFYFLLRLLKNQKLYADAKLSFTSNMTHEFKTPVATVAVALESIVKYKLVNEPEKLREYLEISQSELKRLNIMIEKVLSLNDADAYQKPKKLAVDICQLMEEVITSLKLQITVNNAKIEFECNNDCLIEADALQLTHVFYNLIENALKYASPNAAINISCQPKAAYLSISFTDNGPGIDPIYHQKIFERFFRIPTADIHNVKGTGLGLNYVKEIIEAHNGRIVLESEPNKGTTITLLIPYK